MQKYESYNPEYTISIAKEIASTALPGSIYILEGELGAGKTVFAKGFALGLSVRELITSPTFAILNIYNGSVPFYHFDLYRLQDQIEDQGFEEYFFGNGVCLIEWGQYAQHIIGTHFKKVNILKDSIKGENFRLIEVK